MTMKIRLKPLISFYNLQISKAAHKPCCKTCNISVSNRYVPLSLYSAAHVMLSSGDLKNPQHQTKYCTDGEPTRKAEQYIIQVVQKLKPM